MKNYNTDDFTNKLIEENKELKEIINILKLDKEDFEIRASSLVNELSNEKKKSREKDNARNEIEEAYYRLLNRQKRA